MDLISIIMTSLNLVLIVITVYFLNKSIKQVNKQITLMREERNIKTKNDFAMIWLKIDEYMLQHPEMSELWIEPETFSYIKNNSQKRIH
ncbi:MAG: hypothetical protein IPH62_00910 [Ignavibacteriae bacterium]|nr:hypothetical protein [Ignavibacteriota bacterium]